MRYAYVQDNKVVSVYSTLPLTWNNISAFDKLEGNLETLRAYGFYPIVEGEYNYNPLTQRLSGPTYIVNDFQVFESYTVADIPTEALDTVKENYLKSIRSQRDSLLLQSDWALMPDVVALHDEQWVSDWTSYRQNLRNFPQQFENSNLAFLPKIQSIEWPTVPYSNSQPNSRRMRRV